MADSQSYYLSKKGQLIKDFDNAAKVLRPLLLATLPGQDVDLLINETRQKFTSLIPELPYIGGKQPFTQFISNTGMFLAMYRAFQPRGITLEETGALVYKIGTAYLHAYPSFMFRFFGQMNFSVFYLNRLRKRALESQRHTYPDDYVYSFIPGDGVSFDYGVDYSECAACKFLAKQGAFELARYLCPVDIIYSKALGWGLKRTMTLADGDPRCDFRFKKNGMTDVAVPPSMRALIEEAE